MRIILAAVLMVAVMAEGDDQDGNVENDFLVPDGLADGWVKVDFDFDDCVARLETDSSDDSSGDGSTESESVDSSADDQSSVDSSDGDNDSADDDEASDEVEENSNRRLQSDELQFGHAEDDDTRRRLSEDDGTSTSSDSFSSKRFDFDSVSGDSESGEGKGKGRGRSHYARCFGRIASKLFAHEHGNQILRKVALSMFALDAEGRTDRGANFLDELGFTAGDQADFEAFFADSTDEQDAELLQGVRELIKGTENAGDLGLTDDELQVALGMAEQIDSLEVAAFTAEEEAAATNAVDDYDESPANTAGFTIAGLLVIASLL